MTVVQIFSGYGQSSKYDGDRGEFLIKLVQTLSPNDKPVLVSPSMSGTFSLSLLNRSPELICAYIPGKELYCEFIAKVKMMATKIFDPCRIPYPINIFMKKALIFVVILSLGNYSALRLL